MQSTSHQQNEGIEFEAPSSFEQKIDDFEDLVHEIISEKERTEQEENGSFTLDRKGFNSSKALYIQELKQPRLTSSLSLPKKYGVGMQAQTVGYCLSERVNNELLILCQDPFNNEEIQHSNIEVYFHFKRFALYSLLHFLYYIVIGPLLAILMVLTGNYNLARNMFFVGLTQGFFVQVYIWLAFVTTCGLFFYYNEGGMLDKINLLALSFQIVLRIFIVAARYATTTDNRINESFKRVFTNSENSDEFLGSGWAYLQPHIIDQEIKMSMVRNEIENLSFRIRLLNPLNTEYMERFTNFDFYKDKKFDLKENRQFRQKVLKYLDTLDHSSMKRSMKVQDLPEEAAFEKEIMIFFTEPTEADMDKVFPARLIIKDNFLVSQLACPVWPEKLRRVVFGIYALILFFAPLFKELTDSRYYFPGKYSSLIYWLYNFASCSGVFLFSYFNFSFLEFGRNDMKRKHFRMKVQSCLIEPNRLKLKGQLRLFPLFNFFDQATMQSWLDSRILTLDVGLRYYKRIELYVSLYLIYSAIVVGICLAQYFDIYNFNFRITDYIFISYEQILMISLLYSVLYSGALVNQETEQQILRLSELRIIMEKILIDWDILMNNKHLREEELLNNTFKRAIHYFKYYKRVHGEEKSKKKIEESIRSLSSIQERLQQEKDYNPIKIVGIPTTMGLVKWVQTFAGTIVLLMLQKHFGLE